MKNRGIGVVDILAIVVVIVAVAGAGMIISAVPRGGENAGGGGSGGAGSGEGGGGLGGLPVYPGSRSWEIPSDIKSILNIPAGVKVAGYSVSGASVQDVLNWYKGQMTGWTLENEVPVTSDGGMEIGALVYRNGDNGAGIVVMSGMGLPGTCYGLGTGPWSAFAGAVGWNG